jgi:CheY-like chemotaxis protein
MPHLLWVDDDGPGMFLYEVYQLEQQGWTVEFAENITDAAAALQARDYRAILLDQMMPLGADHNQPVDVWAGCLILWWLRQAGPPPGAPHASIEATPMLWDTTPRPANCSIPILMVSAFDDPDVDEDIRRIQAPSPVQVFVKPVEADLLLQRLATILGTDP